MTVIQRNTQVVSISLSKNTAEKLDSIRRRNGQTRSALISSLIEKEMEDERWDKIFKKGQQSAKKFKITSEEDIDGILHAP